MISPECAASAINKPTTRNEIHPESAYWLDPQTPTAEAKSLLTSSNLDGKLQFRRVSRTVNSVTNQGAECVEPVSPQ